jgi:hypothetical protein
MVLEDTGKTLIKNSDNPLANDYDFVQICIA